MNEISTAGIVPATQSLEISANDPPYRTYRRADGSEGRYLLVFAPDPYYRGFDYDVTVTFEIMPLGPDPDLNAIVADAQAEIDRLARHFGDVVLARDCRLRASQTMRRLR